MTDINPTVAALQECRNLHAIALGQRDALQKTLNDVLGVDILLAPIDQLHNAEFMAGWQQAMTAYRNFIHKLAADLLEGK